MKREGDKPVRVLVESIFEGYLYQEEYWKYSNDMQMVFRSLNHFKGKSLYHKISYRLGDFTFRYLDINAVGTPVIEVIGNSNVVLNWMDNSQYIRKRESAA